jgi:hypothetical protein
MKKENHFSGDFCINLLKRNFRNRNVFFYGGLIISILLGLIIRLFFIKEEEILQILLFGSVIIGCLGFSWRTGYITAEHKFYLKGAMINLIASSVNTLVYLIFSVIGISLKVPWEYCLVPSAISLLLYISYIILDSPLFFIKE